MINLAHPDTVSVLLLFGSVVLPLLSSLLARPRWPGEVVGLLTLLLSAATGFVSQWQAAGDLTHYDWANALGLAAGSYLFAVLGRVALWANTKTDDKVKSI